MTTHTLKILPAYFDPVMSGAKPFEVRSTEYRTFLVGDVLRLQEWDGGGHTGREVWRLVTYVLMAPPYVPPGFAILGLAPHSPRPGNAAGREGQS